MTQSVNTLPSIQAILFDMDGLMLDTEQLNLRCFQQAMVDCGFAPDRTLYLRTVGMTDEDTDRTCLPVLGDMATVRAVRQREQQHLADYIARHGPPLKAGLIEFLDLLDELTLFRAVASSRGRASVTTWLTSAGLAGRLDAMAGGDEVSNGKPAPDIFLLAASRLGVEPSGCLVLEDSIAGIQAAHSAGMVPVMVPDLLQPTAQARAQAFRIVDDLDAVGSLLRERYGVT